MSTNNTFKHISDESKYDKFDPTGTNFPSNVTTVQAALALTSPTTNASETKFGVLKIASLSEVLAGVDDTKAVTPLKLAKRLEYPQATTTVVGILSLATNAEALTGTNSTKSVVPSSLKYVIDWSFDNKKASESVLGTIKLSTQAAAVAGTDNTTAMTPLRVKQAIANATAQIPSPSTATESAPGLVQLSTLGQVAAGTLRSGYAISPYTLNQLKGNTTRAGIVRAATSAEAYTGTDESLYISAKGFKTYIASTTNFGTVKLSDAVMSGSSGVALSANAKVLPTTGGTISGTLNVNGSLNVNGLEVSPKKYVNDSIPVGSIQMWMGTSAPAGGLWAICDGGAESKASRPELFAAIGYKFGGSGDVFYRPDMRGLFVRGAGTGKDILAEQGLDSKGKPKLGVGVSGGNVGQIQKQQMRFHKHTLPWGEAHVTNYAYGGTKLSRYYGSGDREDWDNTNMFTNDGYEVESETIRDSRTTLNTEESIGTENRPWNMSVNYIIKVA